MKELKNLLEKKAEAAYAHAHTNSGPSKFDKGRKSISILAKIQHSLRWELGFTIAFAFACTAMIFQSNSKPVIVFLSLLLIYMVIFFVYLTRVYRNTNDQILSTGTIKASITGTISVLKEFISLYTKLSTSFVPAIFLSAALAGFFDFINSASSPENIPWFSIAMGTLIATLWILLMKSFTRWWMNRLYGNYLRQLSADLDELEAGK